MECVRNHLTIQNHGFRCSWLAIDSDKSFLDSAFLYMSACSCSLFEELYIICQCPFTKLRREDVYQFSPSPTLFAVRIVGEMVGTNFAQSVSQEIRSWPWIARRYDDRW